MSRGARDPVVPLTINVSRRLYAQLEHVASARQCSVGLLVRQVLQNFVIDERDAPPIRSAWGPARDRGGR